MLGSMKSYIEQTLQERLAATHVEVEDESHKHAGHPGAKSGGGHYRVKVASPHFEGLSLLDRQKIINALFAEDIQEHRIHALSVKTYTPDEWITASL
jgi:BolA family transcriptional regulator, general stress-responsive regulator